MKKDEKKKKKKSKKRKKSKKKILPVKYVGLLHSGESLKFGDAVKALTDKLPANVVYEELYAGDQKGDPEDVLYNFGQVLVSRAKAILATAPNNKAVLIAAGGPGPALLLQSLTDSVPIVFTTVTNPGPATVTNPGGLGLVNNVNGPGGTNLTGMAGQTSEHDSDRVVLLFGLMQLSHKPIDKIGVLISGKRAMKNIQYSDVVRSAPHGVTLIPKQAKVKNDIDDAKQEIEDAFDLFKRTGAKGVVVMADSLFNDLRREVVTIANASGLPTVYQWKEFVDVGGLASFGPNILEAYDKAGQYATRILAGADPATMSCSEPTKFFVYMKHKTAGDLGITIPLTVTLGTDTYPVDVIFP